MPVRQRTVKLQNLNTIDTYTQENGAVSEYFNVSDFPDELSTGRSSFLILGSQYLRQDVSIKIEILDNQGNPVYIEPVYSYEEGNGVRVSVEVYQDTSAGAATLTILGEVDPNTVDYDIPQEFIDVYNVKYTRSFIINKDIPNTRPIRFFKRPQITAKEVFRPKLSVVETTQGNLTQTVGLVIGNPVANTEGRNFSLDDASYGEVPNYTDQNYGASPIGNQSANLGEKYTFTIVGAQFSASMQGGTLKITDPQATPYFTTQSFHSVVAYSSSIVEVLNKNTVAVQKPFGIFNSSSGDFEISSIGESLYEINYPKERTFFTSSIDFKSFAEITVHTMRTFSGDVNRIAAYTKNNGPYGNWTKIADTPIEAPELLVDHNSTTSTNRLGFFRSDSIATNYYDVTSGLNGIETSTSVQTASDPEYMANSLFVSSSGVDMLADSEAYGIKLQLKPQYSASFVAGNEYIVRAKLIADNLQGEQDTIKAVFYMSGSAFNMSSTNGQHGYGEAIGRVKYEDASRKLLGQTSPQFEATFAPQRSGTGVLQIRFTGGYWHIADLSIRPASETNFSPEIIKVAAPIPPLAERPDNLDFAVEFYDVNNNKAQTVVTTMPYYPDGITFEGENLVIAGNDNTVEGSLFLGGDTTGSGIQMGGVASTLPESGAPGATGSGFIRSVQYQGYTSASLSADNTGWMIYSGSVLPESGDNYAGVGLELVGQSGSLRFSTIPSRFEVVADAFFVGSTNTQFISGSEGIIEISSSAFHLSSSGDVIISGSITATEGSIAGWNIIDNKLSGSNATLDAVGAALYKSDAGPSTNPYNGYYIDFTPSQANPYYVRFGPHFAVSSSGRLIASGAVIEGTLTASTGFIGNWVIGSNQLYKETSGKFTGMSVAGDTRFFAGATALAGSGSAPFNVKSTGDITGSLVLFTGGKIGGFELASSYLRNTDNTVELSSTLPGLKIKDTSGVSRVEVKSGSLTTVGGGTQYVENNSFEDQVGSLSAGRNFVGAITSWSFAEVGGVNISLTDRNGYISEHKAVSGRVTLDVVVPAGSGNYSTTNTYELVQVVTQSISAGDTLSFSSVARFSSSFSGKGKDRALGPQYFRAEYSASGNGGWIPFLPTAQYTASNGYGEYFLGSGQYNSFGASAELPEAAEYIRLVLTGSINDDSGFTIEKPLFAADKGTVNSDISGRTFTKTVVGSSSPEYPETEITFDNFSLRSNTRKVEMTQEGLLIYNSEDSFLKMTGAGIEFRGGSGLLSAGTSINRESFTNDSQIAGTLAAPSLQAYAASPEPIGGALSPGNVADYARGNHIHTIPSAIITNAITGSLIPSQSITSLSVTHLTGSNISSSGTGSFGQLLIAGQPVATGRWAGGSNIYYTGGSVGIGTDSPGSLLHLEGSSSPTQRIQNTTNNTYLDLRAESSTVLIRSTGAHSMRFDVNQTERMRIDTDGDVGIGSTNPQQKLDVVGNIAVTGTVDGRDLSTDGSKLDGIEASAKDDQTITAGTGLTGGGTGDVTLNVIGGTGITANANDITTTDSEIVHDNLSGFIANEHIDHSGVTITAGSGLTGGGTIQATRTLNIGQGTGIAVSSTAIATNDSEIVHDSLSGFVANEHIDHSGVSISAGDGLTGGGTIASTRTLNIGQGTGITVNDNDIATNDSQIVHDSLSGFVANEHIDHSGVTITAGGILSGGGTIASNRTITLASSDVVHDSTTGFVANEHIDHSAVSISAGGILSGGGTIASNRTITLASSDVVHDSTTGFVANEHIDHSGVEIIAGSGLSGGGTIASSRTINIGGGSGIDVSTNTISVDVSDFMTNGSDNRVLTATGADAMNAEANLTFDGTILSGSATSTGSFGKVMTVGNATFSGDVRIGGTSLTPSGDKDQLVVESTSHGGMSALGPDASEQGFFTGHASSTRVGEFHTRYDTNTMTIGSAKSGMQMLLMTGNRATALTLDSSQNSTFAGNVTLSDGALSVTSTAGTTVAFLGSPSVGGFSFITDSGSPYLHTLSVGNSEQMQFQTNGSVALKLDTSQNATFGGTINGSAGSVGSPAIILNGDTDTGFYYSGANDMGVSVAGTLVGRFVNGSFKAGGTNGGWKLMTSSGAGSASLPVYSFEGDTDTGMYRHSANALALVTGGVSRLHISSAGNVGIGVTPEATEAGYDALQIGGNANITSYGTQGASGQVDYGHNFYFATSGQDKYISTDEATQFRQGGGAFRFRTAPSGTADNAITFTERMTILQAGNVGIGTSSPQTILHLSENTNSNLEIDGSTAGEFRLISINDARNAYEDFKIYGDNVNLNANSGGKVIFTAPMLSGSSTSTGSFGRLEIADNAQFGTVNGDIQIGGGAGLNITHNNSGLTVVTLNHVYGATNAGAQMKLQSGFLTFHTGTSNTERVRIDASGNVGIGDTSPTEGKLVVAGTGASSSPALHLSITESTTFNHFVNMVDSNLTAGENGIIVFGQELDTKNAAWIGYKHRSDHGNDNQLSLGFWGANNLVNILPSGRMGIGTETPSDALHVVGNARVETGGIKIVTNGQLLEFGDSNVHIDRAGNSMNLHAYAGHIFSINGSTAMTIDNSGNLGIGITSPLHPLHVEKALNSNWIAKFKNTGTTNAYGLQVDTTANTTAGEFSLGVYTGVNSGFFVTSDAKVGIHTTGPETAFTIDQTADNDGIRLYGYDDVNSYYGELYIDGSGYTNLDAGTNRGVVLKGHALDFYINSGGTHFARMTWDGKFGIGTTSPSYPLDVNGVAQMGTMRLANGFTLTQGSSNYAVLGGWINVGTIGLYSGTNGAHIYPNTASDYGAWRMNGSKGGWGGITFEVGGVYNTLMSNASSMGMYNDTDNEWMLECARNGVVRLYYNGATKLETASGGVGITGTMTSTAVATTGNVTVGGDLIVNGSTTTVATTNMVVSDNMIELNNGASSNANDSGIVIERGSTGDNAIFVWDESADGFIVGTTTATGASTGNLTIAAAPLQTAALTSTTGTFSGAITATTLNTGQGANELYDMNQNVLTTSSPTFNAATISDNLTMIGGQFYVGGSSGTDNTFRIAETGGTFSIGSRNSGTWNDTRMTLNTSGNATFAGTISITGGQILTPGGVNLQLNPNTGLVSIGGIIQASGTGTNTFAGSMTIANSKAIGSTTYTSGFAGSGWRIDQGITEAGKTSAAIDNLTVRGTMSVYELLIQQVRATNGNLFISSTGKVDVVTHNGGVSYTLSSDTGSQSGHGFAAGDIIRMQRFDNAGTGASVTISDLHVQSISSTGSFTANLINSTTAPAKGFEYVRLGSSSNNARKGGIYLTADDSNAPFIDVFDNIESHDHWNANTGSASSNGSSPGTKVRIGKLDGITSGRFGVLPTNSYGMWASGSVYLEGTVNATTGNIGGWGIGASAISSSGGIIEINADDKRITITDGSNDRIYLGELTGSSTYGMKIFDGTGTTDSDLLVELGQGRNNIVGWDLIPGRLQYDNAAGSIALDATNRQLAIYTGSVDTAKPKVVVGNLPTTGTAKYGFAVFSGSADADINSDSTYSVLITKDEARLAGWDMSPGKLTSGTVARIDGNTATIALGTNATTHTTASPSSSLFFVSASANPIFFVGENFSYVDDVLTAGGWKLGNGIISSSVSADTDGVILDATNKVLTFHGADGKDSFHSGRDKVRLAVGQITSGIYGMIGFDGSGNTLLELSETQALIAGWTISSDNINKNNVKLSAATNGEGLYVKKTSYSSTTAGGFLGLDSGTAKFNVGDSSKYIKFDGSNITMNAGNFSLDSSGNMTATSVTLSGTISASAGEIGGFEIGASQINSANDSLILKEDGQVTGSTIRMEGGKIGNFHLSTYLTSNTDKTTYSDTDSGVYIGSDGIGLGTGQFKVSAAGAITSTSGTIGNWTIGSTLSATNILLDPSTPKITVGGKTSLTSANTGIWLSTDGIALGASSVFKVTHAGALTATSATITGVVTANTGYIGGTNGWTIAAGKITSTGIGVATTTGDATYAFWAGNNTPASAEFNVKHNGDISATSATITGVITANTGYIGGTGGWTITTGNMTSGQVSLQANTTKPGLHVTDGTDTILTVVSSSTGLTNHHALTGSLGSGAADAYIDNSFEEASNGDPIATAPGKWTQESIQWDTDLADGNGSQPNWEKDTTNALINPQCAELPAGTIVTPASYGTPGKAGFYKDFPVSAGTIAVNGYIRGIGWKFYGDGAAVKSYCKVEISGSDNATFASGTKTALFERRVPYTALKPTLVGYKTKNISYASIRVKFLAVHDLSGNKSKQATLGGYTVDGLKFIGLAGSAGSGGTAARSKPLVELTQEGLLVYSSKDSYLRLDNSGFDIKGDIGASNVEVQGDINVSGSMNTFSEINISGSVNFSNDVALALGHSDPEAKIHVSESFYNGTSANSFYPDNMAIGNEPSWKKVPDSYPFSTPAPGYAGDGTDAYSFGSVFKASFRPFKADSPNTGQSGFTAAYGTGNIHDSYGRTQNMMMYGEIITGAAQGFAGAGHEASGSVGIGKNWSYYDNKNQIGVDVHFAYNDTCTNIGEVRQKGFRCFTLLDTTVDNLNGIKSNWGQHGFHYNRQGTLNFDIDAATGGADGGLAGYYGINNSDGTHPTAGYGIYLKDFSKHYFSGYVGIKDTTPSYELDVTGTIRATGNIIAYSDVRHKENIETVTNAIDIINDLRGVRFNWNKQYRDNSEAGGYYKSKKIHEDVLEKRQVGLIAQEVQEVLPELVSEDGEGYLSVNYANLVAVLVEANKEQQTLIEDLQERVKKLETK